MKRRESQMRELKARYLNATESIDNEDLLQDPTLAKKNGISEKLLAEVLKIRKIVCEER